MFLRSWLSSILSNRFISMLLFNSTISASQDVYVVFLQSPLLCANARSPRGSRSARHRAPSCREIPEGECIADDPANPLKKIQTLPKSHCPTHPAAVERRHR